MVRINTPAGGTRISSLWVSLETRRQQGFQAAMLTQKLRSYNRASSTKNASIMPATSRLIPSIDPSKMNRVEANTGREVWRALEEAITWSSPIVIEAGGVRQLIVWTQQSVSSLNPANGKVYWREATNTGGAPGTAGVSTPVWQDDHLLISGWMFQLEKDRPAAKTLWPEGAGVSRRILSDTSTGVLLGDYVYIAKTGGAFVCLKAATGEEVWKTNTVTDLNNGASIHATRHGESAFLFNDRGELIQVRLTAGEYEEINRAKLLEPTSPFGGRKVTWAAPAFAHRNVYARNDRELICVSLAASSHRMNR